MKKKHGLDREVPIVPKAELAGLPTGSLLTRLQRLQRCEDSRQSSDRSAREVSDVQGILFKNTPDWRQAHSDLKSILREREHVPSTAERRAARLARIKAGR